jgi:hypothetical protein
MRARQLVTVSGTVYGPDTLRVITTAFDKAWADLAHSFPPNSPEANACRLKLATAVLAEATEHSRDAHALKNTALRRLQSQHH